MFGFLRALQNVQAVAREASASASAGAGGGKGSGAAFGGAVAVARRRERPIEGPVAPGFLVRECMVLGPALPAAARLTVADSDRKFASEAVKGRETVLAERVAAWRQGAAEQAYWGPGGRGADGRPVPGVQDNARLEAEIYKLAGEVVGARTALSGGSRSAAVAALEDLGRTVPAELRPLVLAAGKGVADGAAAGPGEEGVALTAGSAPALALRPLAGTGGDADVLARGLLWREEADEDRAVAAGLKEHAQRVGARYGVLSDEYRVARLRADAALERAQVSATLGETYGIRVALAAGDPRQQGGLDAGWQAVNAALAPHGIAVARPRPSGTLTLDGLRAYEAQLAEEIELGLAGLGKSREAVRLGEAIAAKGIEATAARQEKEQLARGLAALDRPRTTPRRDLLEAALSASAGDILHGTLSAERQQELARLREEAETEAAFLAAHPVKAGSDLGKETEERRALAQAGTRETLALAQKERLSRELDQLMLAGEGLQSTRRLRVSERAVVATAPGSAARQAAEAELLAAQQQQKEQQQVLPGLEAQLAGELEVARRGEEVARLEFELEAYKTQVLAANRQRNPQQFAPSFRSEADGTRKSDRIEVVVKDGQLYQQNSFKGELTGEYQLSWGQNAETKGDVPRGYDGLSGALYQAGRRRDAALQQAAADQERLLQEKRRVSDEALAAARTEHGSGVQGRQKGDDAQRPHGVGADWVQLDSGLWLHPELSALQASRQELEGKAKLSARERDFLAFRLSHPDLIRRDGDARVEAQYARERTAERDGYFAVYQQGLLTIPREAGARTRNALGIAMGFAVPEGANAHAPVDVFAGEQLAMIDWVALRIREAGGDRAEVTPTMLLHVSDAEGVKPLVHFKVRGEDGATALIDTSLAYEAAILGANVPWRFDDLEDWRDGNTLSDKDTVYVRDPDGQERALAAHNTSTAQTLITYGTMAADAASFIPGVNVIARPLALAGNAYLGATQLEHLAAMVRRGQSVWSKEGLMTAGSAALSGLGVASPVLRTGALYRGGMTAGAALRVSSGATGLRSALNGDAGLVLASGGLLARSARGLDHGQFFGGTAMMTASAGDVAAITDFNSDALLNLMDFASGLHGTVAGGLDIIALPHDTSTSIGEPQRRPDEVIVLPLREPPQDIALRMPAAVVPAELLPAGPSVAPTLLPHHKRQPEFLPAMARKPVITAAAGGHGNPHPDERYPLRIVIGQQPGEPGQSGDAGQPAHTTPANRYATPFIASGTPERDPAATAAIAAALAASSDPALFNPALLDLVRQSRDDPDKDQQERLRQPKKHLVMAAAGTNPASGDTASAHPNPPGLVAHDQPADQSHANPPQPTPQSHSATAAVTPSAGAGRAASPNDPSASSRDRSPPTTPTAPTGGSGKPHRGEANEGQPPEKAGNGQSKKPDSPENKPTDEPPSDRTQVDDGPTNIGGGKKVNEGSLSINHISINYRDAMAMFRDMIKEDLGILEMSIDDLVDQFSRSPTAMELLRFAHERNVLIVRPTLNPQSIHHHNRNTWVGAETNAGTWYDSVNRLIYVDADMLRPAGRALSRHSFIPEFARLLVHELSHVQDEPYPSTLNFSSNVELEGEVLRIGLGGEGNAELNEFLHSFEQLLNGGNPAKTLAAPDKSENAGIFARFVTGELTKEETTAAFGEAFKKRIRTVDNKTYEEHFVNLAADAWLRKMEANRDKGERSGSTLDTLFAAAQTMGSEGKNDSKMPYDEAVRLKNAPDEGTLTRDREREESRRPINRHSSPTVTYYGVHPKSEANIYWQIGAQKPAADLINDGFTHLATEDPDDPDTWRVMPIFAGASEDHRNPTGQRQPDHGRDGDVGRDIDDSHGGQPSEKADDGQSKEPNTNDPALVRGGFPETQPERLAVEARIAEQFGLPPVAIVADGTEIRVHVRGDFAALAGINWSHESHSDVIEAGRFHINEKDTILAVEAVYRGNQPLGTGRKLLSAALFVAKEFYGLRPDVLIVRRIVNKETQASYDKHGDLKSTVMGRLFDNVVTQSDGHVRSFDPVFIDKVVDGDLPSKELHGVVRIEWTDSGPSKVTPSADQTTTVNKPQTAAKRQLEVGDDALRRNGEPPQMPKPDKAATSSKGKNSSTLADVRESVPSSRGQAPSEPSQGDSARQSDPLQDDTLVDHLERKYGLDGIAVVYSGRYAQFTDDNGNAVTIVVDENPSVKGAPVTAVTWSHQGSDSGGETKLTEAALEWASIVHGATATPFVPFEEQDPAKGARAPTAQELQDIRKAVNQLLTAFPEHMTADDVDLLVSKVQIMPAAALAKVASEADNPSVHYAFVTPKNGPRAEKQMFLSEDIFAWTEADRLHVIRHEGCHVLTAPGFELVFSEEEVPGLDNFLEGVINWSAWFSGEPVTPTFEEAFKRDIADDRFGRQSPLVLYGIATVAAERSIINLGFDPVGMAVFQEDPDSIRAINEERARVEDQVDWYRFPTYLHFVLWDLAGRPDVEVFDPTLDLSRRTPSTFMRILGADEGAKAAAGRSDAALGNEGQTDTKHSSGESADGADLDGKKSPSGQVGFDPPKDPPSVGGRAHGDPDDPDDESEASSGNAESSRAEANDVRPQTGSSDPEGPVRHENDPLSSSERLRRVVVREDSRSPESETPKFVFAVYDGPDNPEDFARLFEYGIAPSADRIADAAEFARHVAAVSEIGGAVSDHEHVVWATSIVDNARLAVEFGNKAYILVLEDLPDGLDVSAVMKDATNFEGARVYSKVPGSHIVGVRPFDPTYNQFAGEFIPNPHYVRANAGKDTLAGTESKNPETSQPSTLTAQGIRIDSAPSGPLPVDPRSEELAAIDKHGDDDADVLAATAPDLHPSPQAYAKHRGLKRVPIIEFSAFADRTPHEVLFDDSFFKLIAEPTKPFAAQIDPLDRDCRELIQQLSSLLGTEILIPSERDWARWEVVRPKPLEYDNKFLATDPSGATSDLSFQKRVASDQHADGETLVGTEDGNLEPPQLPGGPEQRTSEEQPAPDEPGDEGRSDTQHSSDNGFDDDHWNGNEAAPTRDGIDPPEDPPSIGGHAAYGDPGDPDDGSEAGLVTEGANSIDRPKDGPVVPEALRARVDPVFVTRLAELVRSRGGQITFRDFMEHSLHGIKGYGGYYNSGTVSIGSDHSNQDFGDFKTAPEQSKYFGYSIANSISEIYASIGNPERFHVVEMGAGNGSLARSVIERLRVAHPEVYRALDYIIIERSKALVARQREQLEGYNVEWLHASAYELPLRQVTGVFISNELPDTFPVHQVEVRNGALREIYVSVGADNKFVEVDGELSPALADNVHLVDQLVPGWSSLPDGHRLTINLQAVNWLRQVGAALNFGSVITIDYGVPGAAQRAPYAVFKEQLPLEVAYEVPGAVDITSLVDFVNLLEVGRNVGLEPSTLPRLATLSRQSDFLRANGFVDASELESDLGELTAAAQLLHSYDTFHVLVQQKKPTENDPQAEPGDDPLAGPDDRSPEPPQPPAGLEHETRIDASEKEPSRDEPGDDDEDPLAGTGGRNPGPSPQPRVGPSGATPDRNNDELAERGEDGRKPVAGAKDRRPEPLPQLEARPSRRETTDGSKAKPEIEAKEATTIDAAPIPGSEIILYDASITQQVIGHLAEKIEALSDYPHQPVIYPYHGRKEPPFVHERIREHPRPVEPRRVARNSNIADDQQRYNEKQKVTDGAYLQALRDGLLSLEALPGGWASWCTDDSTPDAVKAAKHALLESLRELSSGTRALTDEGQGKLRFASGYWKLVQLTMDLPGHVQNLVHDVRATFGSKERNSVSYETVIANADNAIKWTIGRLLRLENGPLGRRQQLLDGEKFLQVFDAEMLTIEQHLRDLEGAGHTAPPNGLSPHDVVAIRGKISAVREPLARIFAQQSDTEQWEHHARQQIMQLARDLKDLLWDRGFHLPEDIQALPPETQAYLKAREALWLRNAPEPVVTTLKKHKWEDYVPGQEYNWEDNEPGKAAPSEGASKVMEVYLGIWKTVTMLGRKSTISLSEADMVTVIGKLQAAQNRAFSLRTERIPSAFSEEMQKAIAKDLAVVRPWLAEIVDDLKKMMAHDSPPDNSTNLPIFNTEIEAAVTFLEQATAELEHSGDVENMAVQAIAQIEGATMHLRMYSEKSLGFGPPAPHEQPIVDERADTFLQRVETRQKDQGST